MRKRAWAVVGCGTCVEEGTAGSGRCTRPGLVYHRDVHLGNGTDEAMREKESSIIRLYSMCAIKGAACTNTSAICLRQKQPVPLGRVRRAESPRPTEPRAALLLSFSAATPRDLRVFASDQPDDDAYIFRMCARFVGPEQLRTLTHESVKLFRQHPGCFPNGS
jgi:hypothetical protein